MRGRCDAAPSSVLKPSGVVCFHEAPIDPGGDQRRHICLAEVTVKRIDHLTLEVESGAYLALGDRVCRNEEHPLKIGETVMLSRMTATVLSVTEDQRPERVAFRFEVPLEDSSLRWLCWKHGEYVPWTPPKVGDEITLKAG